MQDTTLTNKFINRWGNPAEVEEFQRLLRERAILHARRVEGYQQGHRYASMFSIHRELRLVDLQLRGLRAAIRNNHRAALGHGVYSVRGSMDYHEKVGMYGLKYGGRLKAGSIVIFVDMDDMNRCWFLTSENNIIAVYGTALDKLVYIGDNLGDKDGAR